VSALAGIVVQLETMRAESGLSMREVSARAGADAHLYRDTVGRLSGPILDRINRLAKVFGHRLALVPIEGRDHE
jgi:hypothetical protein